MYYVSHWDWYLEDHDHQRVVVESAASYDTPGHQSPFFQGYEVQEIEEESVWEQAE